MSDTATGLDQVVDAVTRKGRKWSTEDLNTIEQGIMFAHNSGVYGTTKVAAHIFDLKMLPDRSLYSIFWQVRKDRQETV